MSTRLALLVKANTPIMPPALGSSPEQMNALLYSSFLSQRTSLTMSKMAKTVKTMTTLILIMDSSCIVTDQNETTVLLTTALL